MLSMFFTAFLRIPGAENIMFTDSIYFTILISACVALSFISIFLFKNRILQIRLNVINAIIMICFQAWLLYKFFSFSGEVAFSVSTVFPIVSAILTFMAIKYIARDEALVRESNSFRKMRK